jgi:hypothetical protein
MGKLSIIHLKYIWAIQKKSVLHNYLVSQHLKKPIEPTKWHVDFEHVLGQVDPRRLVLCALLGD